MKLKRAIGIALLAYIVSFIVGILTASFLGIDPMASTEVPDSLWYAGFVTGVVLMALFSWWYFASSQVKPGAKSGLHFGLVAMAVGFAVDGVFILMALASGGLPESMGSYYVDPYFWVSVGLMLLTTTAVGALKAR